MRRESVDDSFLEELVPHPVLRQILAHRGVKEAADLDMSLKALLPPFTLTDIDKAAARIAQAIKAQEKVMISGDYDVDGMSGTTLGITALKMLGLSADHIFYHVPSRYVDGYGLSKLAVDEAVAHAVTLIVTVDTGITAMDSVEYARTCGIEVVVTDHHEMQEEIPQAVAVVDPKRRDDVFPSKNLCGCGVLFYVMVATRALLIKEGYYPQAKPPLQELLDLVALGTIGDMMSLDANNRRILRVGLARMNRDAPGNLGLKALLKNTKAKPGSITGHSIAFEVCPRINAATRIKLDSNPAMAVFLSTDPTVADQYAAALDGCNHRRMDHEKVMLARAVELYRQDLTERAQVRALHDDQATVALSQAVQKDEVEPDYGIVLFDPSFLNGIVGLVANKMRERFGVPCIVFGADLGAGKEGGFDLFSEAQSQAVADGISPLSLEEMRQQKIAEFFSPECKQGVVGSARSCEGIDLMSVFSYIKEQDPEIFLGCGGHAMAAGATVRACDIPRFRELFNAACKHFTLKDEEQGTKSEPVVYTDAHLDAQSLNLDFALALNALGPWGKDYEEPVFDGVFIVQDVLFMGAKKQHMRFYLISEDGTLCQAVRFKATKNDKLLQPQDKVQVIYKVDIDRFYEEKLQLMISKIEKIEN